MAVVVDAAADDERQVLRLEQLAVLPPRRCVGESICVRIGVRRRVELWSCAPKSPAATGIPTPNLNGTVVEPAQRQPVLGQ